MSSDYIHSLREKRYPGSKTNIVIGIDVGTTFSGVSYAILRPGEPPKIFPVSRFSDQVSGGYSKIPSVIYYDDRGTAKAIGASTTKAMIIQEAEKKGWTKAEYFKMHLRPSSQRLETNGLKIPDLPPGKSAEQVMGDFLRYLLHETGKYITNAHGERLWNQVKDNAIYILGHPNGWSGYPQQRYRTSAIIGGLIPDTAEGHKRIKFVTEGEASALACLSGGLGSPTLTKGFRFIITDAGGGTIDTTTFEVLNVTPLQLKECAPADCRFAGSVFVNLHAGRHLEGKLRNSMYDDNDALDSIIKEEFEKRTKKEFTGSSDGLLQIGSRRDNDEKLGISHGFLSLQRDELASFFQLSVSQTVDSIHGQFTASRSNKSVTPIWLVGGFGTSEFLLKELRKAFEQYGTTIQTPDTNLSKAVANGAVLHYIDEIVVARVCQKTYGTSCVTAFDPERADHLNRPDLIKLRPNDTLCIGPIFDVIVKKGTLVDVKEPFSCSYTQRFLSRDKAKNYTTELLCYEGDEEIPYWYNENKDKFTIYKLEADLSSMCREPSLFEAVLSPIFLPSWSVAFDIELKFGTTEVEAAIKWKENGVVKNGPPLKMKIDRQK